LSTAPINHPSEAATSKTPLPKRHPTAIFAVLPPTQKNAKMSNVQILEKFSIFLAYYQRFDLSLFI